MYVRSTGTLNSLIVIIAKANNNNCSIDWNTHGNEWDRLTSLCVIHSYCCLLLQLPPPSPLLLLPHCKRGRPLMQHRADIRRRAGRRLPAPLIHGGCVSCASRFRVERPHRGHTARNPKTQSGLTGVTPQKTPRFNHGGRIVAAVLG